jgi:hypothetical protein
MPYEPGMSIALENRKCVLYFRGQKYILPGEFDGLGEALRAGEEFCRKLGWAG